MVIVLPHQLCAFVLFFSTVFDPYSRDAGDLTQKEQKVLNDIWKYPILGFKFHHKEEDTGNDKDQNKDADNMDDWNETAKDNCMRLFGFVCLLKMLHQANILTKTTSEMDSLVLMVEMKNKEEHWMDRDTIKMEISDNGLLGVVRDTLKIIPFFCNQVGEHGRGQVTSTHKTKNSNKNSNSNIEPLEIVMSKPNVSFLREKGEEQTAENNQDEPIGMPNAYHMEIASESTLFMLMMDAGVLKDSSNPETVTVDMTNDDSTTVKKRPKEGFFCNCVQPPVNSRDQRAPDSLKWETTYGNTDPGFNAVTRTIYTMLYSRRSKQALLQTQTDAFHPAADDTPDRNKPTARANLFSSAMTSTSKMMDCMAVAQTVTEADAHKFYHAMVSVTELWWWYVCAIFELIDCFSWLGCYSIMPF